MPIKRKLKNNIIRLESSPQMSFFGYDNLSFKTVNLPKPQRFENLCKTFNIKKIIINDSFLLNYIKI